MAIRIDALDYQQADFRLQCTFELEPGECLVVLGPSGSGKSTLLRCIAGLLPLVGGKILVNNSDISKSATKDRGLGFVFQDYALFPHLSVLENVAYPLHVRHAADWHSRSMAILERCGIAALKARLPDTLSGGEQQRCALARSLVYGPSLLLLDEPLSALDRELRIHLRQEIRGLVKDLGLAAIYVTHDQEEALSLADRLVVLRAGQIVASGCADTLYQNPPNLFTACFIGESSALSIRDQGTLHLRPEDCFVSESGSGLALEVTSSEYRGREWLIRGQSSWGEICWYAKHPCPIHSQVYLEAKRGHWFPLGDYPGKGYSSSAKNGFLSDFLNSISDLPRAMVL